MIGFQPKKPMDLRKLVLFLIFTITIHVNFMRVYASDSIGQAL